MSKFPFLKGIMGDLKVFDTSLRTFKTTSESAQADFVCIAAILIAGLTAILMDRAWC
jgi:hypothetical protein